MLEPRAAYRGRRSGAPTAGAANRLRARGGRDRRLRPRAAPCACLLVLLAVTGPTAQDPGARPRIVAGPNLRASDNATGGNRNEPWVAISSTDPDLIVGVSQIGADGGALGCATMVSRNGGQTWREIRLPEQEDGCFDPLVVAGPEGRLYVLHTIMARAPAGSDPGAGRPGRMRVWTTEDGVIWSGPVEIDCPVPPDHPRMVVDKSDGPRRGRLYIVWNEARDTFLEDHFHLFLHYSDDGAESFSKPVPVTSAEGGKLVATDPVVLSDGTLLVTYYQFFAPISAERSERRPLYVVRSDDGGATFGSPRMAFEFGLSAWRHLRPDFLFAFTVPVVVADTSPASPYRDRIYAVWDDVTTGESTIWLIRSEDRGETWSSPVRVNDNQTAAPAWVPDHRVTPVVAVNHEGVVGVAWYDRRDDPSRRCWHQYFTASSDGGESFLPNVAISSAASCPAPNLPPSVHVSNLSDATDESVPTDAEIARLPEGAERSRLEQELALREALQQAYGDTAPRIRIGFDRGRNVWPGHYSGLAAEPGGGFRALWADRRGAGQQLYTARAEIAAAAPAARPPTREADLTERVSLLAGPATFNEAQGTVTFELQVRNVSDRPIFPPLRVEVSRIEQTPAGPTVEFVDADAGGGGVGAAWEFTDALGMLDRLAPGMVTEARTITATVQVESGLDGVFEFRVLGQVPPMGDLAGRGGGG